ncbi:MAG TPA: SMC-Scp complex subunit ScpB [Herpetosiphonaceae bacterium]
MTDLLQTETLALGVEAEFGPKQLVESLLFVAAEPVPVRDLSRAIGLPLETIEALLDELMREYRARGIRIMRHNDQVQLVSAPEAATVVERFLGVQSSAPRLSNAALETLAIIAYKQPLTRSGIEAVRGVDSAGAVRTLLQRGLILEVGRLQAVGRPVLYGTTEEFLKQFGLPSLAHLPAMEFPAVEVEGEQPQSTPALASESSNSIHESL